MKIISDIDHSTLNWVKEELDDTLEQAGQALEAFSENQEDTTQLRFCATYLHQVHGILEMLELFGAAMLAEEMESVSRALLEGLAERTAEANEVLMRSILQLSDYLERLQGGYRDVPILILPLLNDLRAVRGENLLTENSFFTPNLDFASDEPIIHFQGVTESMEVLAKKYRHAYQIGLLGVIRNQDVAKSLRSLLLVLDKLSEAASSERTQLVWSIGAALCDALAHDALERSTAVKMLLGQIDRLIKGVIETGEDVLLEPVQRDLIRNLLYYVGRAKPATERITAVQERFNLKALIPDEEELAKAREGISGPTSNMLATVAEAVKEDLAHVKDGLDLYIRGNKSDRSRMAAISEVMSRVADTIGMIGLGASRNILKEKARLLDGLADGVKDVDDNQLMDCAQSVLLVESALDELVRRPVGFDQRLAEKVTAELESETRESLEYELFKLEYDDIFQAAIKECLEDIAQIKESVLLFIESHEHEKLDEVPSIFTRLTGVLIFLEKRKVAKLIDLSGQYLAQEILFKRYIPSSLDMDILADAITSIEYYLEGFEAKTGGRESVLDLAAQSVELLGYALSDYADETWSGHQIVRDEAKEQRASSATTATKQVDAEVAAKPAADTSWLDSSRNDTPEDAIDGTELLEKFAVLDLQEQKEQEKQEQEKVATSDAEDSVATDAAQKQVAEADSASGQAADTGFAAAPATAPVQPEELKLADLEVIKADADPEILEIFMEEADELMQELSQNVPLWLANPTEIAPLQVIRRNFHTFKGSGRLAGAMRLGEFAWHIERMLNQVIENLIQPDQLVVEVMEQTMLALPELIEQVKNSVEPQIDAEAIFWKAGVLANPARHHELGAATLEQQAEAVDEYEDEAEIVEDIAEDTAAELASADTLAEEAAVESEIEGLPELEQLEISSEYAEAEVEAEAEAEAEAEPEEAQFELDPAISTDSYDESEQPVAASEEGYTGGAAEIDFGEPLLSLDEDLASDQESDKEPVFEAFELDAEAEPEPALAAESDAPAAIEPALEPEQPSEAELEAEPEPEPELQSEPQPEPEPEAAFAIDERPELITAQSAGSTEADDIREPMDATLYEIFSKEVADHLASVKQFVAVARKEKNKNYVNQEMLRALHTLSGSAKMAGADAISSISSLLEHYAQEHMARQIGFEDSDLERICQGVDFIENDLAAHADPELTPPDITDYVAELKELVAVFDTTTISQTMQAELISDEKDFDLIELFIDEAADILEFLETTIQRIEDDPTDKASLTELHRSLHTLKGGARLAGFTGIGTLSNALEGVVSEIDEGKLEASEAFVEVVHLTFDRLSDMVEQARQGKSAPPQDEILSKIALLHGDEAPTEKFEEQEEQDMELVEVFLEEAEEILTSSNNVLQNWIDEPDNSDLIIEMQRALHTFKGGARMAGFWPMGNLGHVLETLLVDVQEGRVPPSDAFFDLLEAIQIRLEEMLESAKIGAAIRDPDDLLVAIEKLRQGEVVELEAPAKASKKESASTKSAEQADAEALPAKSALAQSQAEAAKADTAAEVPVAAANEMVRVRADLLDNLVNYAGEVSLYRARTEQQVTTLSTNLVEMEQTVLRLREQLRKLEIETEAQILFRYEREGEHREISDFDPLEMDRFSTLQQLSRALAESVGDLFNIGGTLDHITRDAETLLLQQSRVNTELQEGLMRCRMVPFANAVPRLRRILRQTCQELGKKAQLKVIGAQGEMDRTVMERITAPLEHLLRNSVAHGIEPPETRLKNNKDEMGSVSITVSREGPEVVIRVADDGGGINHDAIREKAKKLGWMREDQVLSDTEVAQFILETGFSTAENVSQIAGRGVGMEVVHNEIKQLGGTLHILSERAIGTEFTIRLPFTLAINQVLMVQVLEEVYAIPLSSIDGVVRMTHEQLTRSFAKPEESWYDYAGQRYQVVSMANLLGSGAPILPGEGKRSPVVLVQAGENRLAIHVEGLLGNREIVVKAVGPQVSSVPGIMGATILGNGQVVLILDLGALVRISVSGHIEPMDLSVSALPEKVRKYMVMVVDDSITVRKVTARLLERHGFDALTAKDGVDAVTQLQEVIPDIMLLDVEMPRMDGFELATHMRNDEQLSKVPIIMITSRTGEKHRERARKIGVNDYMGKPYQESELLQKVRQFLGISDA